MGIGRILQEIDDEYVVATNKFGSFNSAHEGYAVILEELEELKDEVFKKRGNRDLEKMREEAIQLATMAVRFIKDICERRL